MYENITFQWWQPTRQKKTAISIPNEKCLNINAALYKELPSKLLIGYNAEKLMLIIQSSEEGYTIPKSGSVKCPDLIRILTQHGLRFPAHFSVEKDNEKWYAHYEQNEMLGKQIKKVPKRRKKPDLASLSKEAAML